MKQPTANKQQRTGRPDKRPVSWGTPWEAVGKHQEGTGPGDDAEADDGDGSEAEGVGPDCGDGGEGLPW